MAFIYKINKDLKNNSNKGVDCDSEVVTVNGGFNVLYCTKDGQTTMYILDN